METYLCSSQKQVRIIIWQSPVTKSMRSTNLRELLIIWDCRNSNQIWFDIPWYVVTSYMLYVTIQFVTFAFFFVSHDLHFDSRRILRVKSPHTSSTSFFGWTWRNWSLPRQKKRDSIFNIHKLSIQSFLLGDFSQTEKWLEIEHGEHSGWWWFIFEFHFLTLSVAQGLADSPNFSSSKNPRTF